MERSGSRSDLGSPSGGSGPEPSAPEERPLVETKGGAPRALLAILVAIIVVLAAALAVVSVRLLSTPAPTPTAPTGTFSVQAARPTGVQGQPLTFIVSNLRSGTQARVYFGDGQVRETSEATFTYTYGTPGNYLVRVQEFYSSNGTVLSDLSGSLFKVTIVPDVPLTLSQFVAVPTIYFNTTRNPTAPVTALNSPIYVYGNYTEISQLFTNSVSHHDNKTGVTDTETVTVAVDHYAWDFGNGQTMTVTANPATSYPVTNPIPVTYTASGLYPVTLALVTTETLTTTIMSTRLNLTYTDTINSYSVTLGTTIAAGSFAIAKLHNIVPSPTVITEIVNSAGGPFSFDPQVDYETVGAEIVFNTQAPLLWYNGSSTTEWFPYIASEVPSVANGEIANNFMTYTFHIRPNVGFSNGDPISAYDVWYTTIRSILFQGGVPGTADWIPSQYLLPRDAPPYFAPFVPVVNATNKAQAYAAITSAVTYDNTTNAVTFHLVRTTPPSLFFTAISDSLGMGILDAAWLKSIGAGITFTPDGFLAYQDQSQEGLYNQVVQFHPVASGPFQVNTYVPSTSVVLTPNPYFPGIPNIPKQTNTIILEWVSSPAVAYQLFASGQGDIVTILPPPYVKTTNDTLVSAGQAKINGPFPSLNEGFWEFNLKVNTTLLPSLGPGYSIPSDYFANPLVRQAFAYAFNYTNYVDRILGNKIYGFNFGAPYCGVIVKGLPDYVPPQNLSGCPSYDLNKAKSLLYESGMYNVSVDFPIAVTTGVTTDFTAAIVLGQAIASIDPHIKISPLYVNFDTQIGYMAADANPMPMADVGWIADYPYPSDYTDAMYLVGGTFPSPDGWDPTYLSRLATTHASQAALYSAQATNYSSLGSLITQADLATDPAKAASLYAQAEQVAVKLYMYIYTVQATQIWIVKPYISPYQDVWGYQENPTIGAGADSCFFWWVKG